MDWNNVFSLFFLDFSKCRYNPTGKSTYRFLLFFTHLPKFSTDSVWTVRLPQRQTLPFSSWGRLHLSVQQQHLLVELKQLISPHTRIAFCSRPSASRFCSVSPVISAEFLRMDHRANWSRISRDWRPPSPDSPNSTLGSGKNIFSRKPGSWHLLERENNLGAFATWSEAHSFRFLQNLARTVHGHITQMEFSNPMVTWNAYPHPHPHPHPGQKTNSSVQKHNFPFIFFGRKLLSPNFKILKHYVMLALLKN